MVVTSGASVCKPTISGNGTTSTALTIKKVLVVELDYSCSASADGRTNMTFTVTLGQFSPLQFRLTKYNNFRPGLGITLTSSDGTVQASSVSKVVVAGHTQ